MNRVALPLVAIIPPLEPEGGAVTTVFRSGVASGSSTSDLVEAAHPLLRARRDGWTPERQEHFIAAVRMGETVAAAARLAGMSRESAYRLRANPRAAGFAASWAAIYVARKAGPTLMKMLDNPVYIAAAEARMTRAIAKMEQRPDFTRWVIRRLNVMQKSIAKA